MTTNTEAMLAALLPCPFCGNEAPEFERMGTARQSCIVVCGNCGCRHESSDEGARCGSSWNTRADLTQAEQRHAPGQCRHATSGCNYPEGECSGACIPAILQRQAP